MTYLPRLALGLLLCLGAPKHLSAQSAIPAGVLTYEGMQKLDPSQLRVVINGDVVQPGSPGAPELPDVVSFPQKLIFSGPYAREEREVPAPVIRRFDGSGRVTEPHAPLRPTFTEKRYLDLSTQTRWQVLEVGKDSARQRYQAEMLPAKATDWQDTDKTRKIAGYTCRKATGSWNGTRYTLWYTTQLPFTYSPVAALTPPKGVVLELESDRESFKASRVEAAAVSEQEVRPEPGTRVVSAAQLEELRRQAEADFRQQLFSAPFPNH